ncbi:MAG: glycosyltransferase [Dysgonamonadaceae bacterium]|jgi:glycosyltransferase involved in cell wall biosynthesis|nr:glycosyltransferase [Dysgonamonadaceae bacterium]
MNLENEIKISVIIPVYNGERFIGEAIESILNQTFTDFELIIVNNCSTDSTAAVVARYNDPRIIYVENEKNMGVIFSLNRGLSMSSGKYIARIDADDIALPRRLQIQYDYMEKHPEIGVLGSSVESFDNNTGKSQRVDFALTDKAIRAFTFFQSPFNQPSVIFRKSVLDENGLKYPEGYYLAEDYSFWVDLLKVTKGANLSEILLRYRKHEKSETTVADKVVNSRAEVVIRVHHKYLENNNIRLDSAQLETFTLFTDRSFRYELNSENQRAADLVINIFLEQLKANHPELLDETLKNLSAICFYKFLKYRKIPQTKLFLNLFLKGGAYYAGKLFGK